MSRLKITGMSRTRVADKDAERQVSVSKLNKTRPRGRPRQGSGLAGSGKVGFNSNGWDGGDWDTDVGVWGGRAAKGLNGL